MWADIFEVFPKQIQIGLFIEIELGIKACMHENLLRSLKNANRLLEK